MSAPEEKINRYDHGPYHWFLPYFYARRHERPLELIGGLLKRSDVVLDLGCGDGRLTSLVANRVERVIGLDHQELPLQFARRLMKRDNIGLCCGQAVTLPFPTERFDVVTCFDVIEHIPRERVASLMSAVQRVLRPGGLFIVTTPNRDNLRNRLWGHRLNEKHYYEYNLAELSGTFRGCGFTVEWTAGIYLPPPILQPYLEHYANVFPIKHAFRLLIRAGARLPRWSETLLLVVRRQET